MTLFERVKEVSKKHGFSSLQTLSEAAGLSPNVIYGWKTKKPSAASLQAVADQLNVSVDYLLGNTDEMHPHSALEDEYLRRLSDKQIAVASSVDPDADLDDIAMENITQYIREQTMLAHLRIEKQREEKKRTE
jgi:transcriptional regulator with XRE-family HTH domain